MLMKKIIIVFGVVLFLTALFDKFGTWQLIEKKGSECKSKFFYTLSQCRFCITFHLGWIITLFVGAFSCFTWELLPIPFVVSGLLTLKK